MAKELSNKQRAQQKKHNKMLSTLAKNAGSITRGDKNAYPKIFESSSKETHHAK